MSSPTFQVIILPLFYELDGVRRDVHEGWGGLQISPLRFEFRESHGVERVVDNEREQMTSLNAEDSK